MSLVVYVYLVRKKEVNFILSYYTNLSHTGQEKFTSFFRMVYIYKYTETANFNFRAVPSGLNPFQRIQLQRHENVGPNSAKKIVTDLENYDTKVLRFRSYKQTRIIASVAFLVWFHISSLFKKVHFHCINSLCVSSALSIQMKLNI